MSMGDPSFEIIAEAFSRTAEKYDAFAEDHPHLTRLRGKVYLHVERFVPHGSRILELNAGTGTDAVQLAERGYFVHATDISSGMLDRLRGKVRDLNLRDRVTVEERSFLSLDHIPGAPFDMVFSNFGGLNFAPDLSPVIRQLPKVLKIGGVVTWVLMPHICLWEIREMFRGNFRLAFRRFTKHPVRTDLEGLHFDVYYFSPRQVIDWFSKDFDLLALEGLSVITPTVGNKQIAKQRPRLYRILSRLDDKLSSHYPWNSCGDFYMLTMQYTPKSSHKLAA